MPSRRAVLGALAPVALAGSTDYMTGSDTLVPTSAASEAEAKTEPESDRETCASTLAPDATLLTVTDGDDAVALLTAGGVASVGSVGSVESTRTGAYALPVVLHDDARRSFGESLARAGALESPQEHEIRTHAEGGGGVQRDHHPGARRRGRVR
jgi:hypothetical protein